MSYRNIFYRYRLIYVFILMIILLVLSNMICLGIIHNLNKNLISNIKEIDEYKLEIGNLLKVSEEEKKDYAYDIYVKKLEKLFTEQELIYLAQKQWEYILTVDGLMLDKDTLYIEGDNLIITLIELNVERDILPLEILEKGTITGSDDNDALQDHMSVYTTITYSVVTDDLTDQGRKVIYTFKNIPHGTLISLKVSPILAERLQLKKDYEQWDNHIEIIRQ